MENSTPTVGSTHSKTGPRKSNVLVGVVAGFVVLTAMVTLVASFAKKPPTLISQQFSSTQASETFTPSLDGGIWQVSDGTYKLTSPIVAATDDIGNTNLSINNTEVKVSIWELSTEAKSNSDFSVVFDYVDELHYSYANFSTQPSDTTHGVFKVEDGVQTKIADYDKGKLAAITSDKNYRIEIRKKKDEIKVYADFDNKANQYLAKASVGERTSSKIGYGSRGGSAVFDNLVLSGQGGTGENPAPTPTPTPTPPSSTIPSTAPPIITTAPDGGRSVQVSNSEQLEMALSDAHPGDVITMADGVYTTKGDQVFVGPQNAAAKFRVNGKSGTASKPIVLQGTRNAVIDGKPGGVGVGGDYGLHLFNSNYWVIRGIRITNIGKGLVLDNSDNNVIDGVMVDLTGDEAVHFRTDSSSNLIKNSFVTNTGHKSAGYGEAIYVGSDGGNWAKLQSDKSPDEADANQIIDNTITNFTGEGIDVKEAASFTVIRGNFFDGGSLGVNRKDPSKSGKPQNSADSWIDIKGDNTLVENNSGVNIPALDKNSAAFQVRNHGPAGYNSGNDNIFRNNKVISGNEGLAFWVDTSTRGNILSCTNTIQSAAKGFSNIGTCKETGN